jgi:hypothetical protein
MPRGAQPGHPVSALTREKISEALRERHEGLGGNMAEKFMQKASEEMEAKGTKGSFTRAAKRAGKGVQEYAREKASSGGAMGKKARFALAAGSVARKHKRSKSRGGGR